MVNQSDFEFLIYYYVKFSRKGEINFFLCPYTGQSFCLSLLSVGVIGMQNHAQYECHCFDG